MDTLMRENGNGRPRGAHCLSVTRTRLDGGAPVYITA